MKLLADLIQQCEAEEERLCYAGGGSEDRRKRSGSYYTPADVARRFWRDFLSLHAVQDAASATKFAANYEFLEPAAGSGILFFALLECLLDLGVSWAVLDEMEVYLIDISPHATAYLERNLQMLRSATALEFRNVRIVRADFLSWEKQNDARSVLCFGNPPFVSTTGDEWRNSAAAFLDKALKVIGRKGALNFIMPLSIAFSKDYRKIRRLLLEFEGLLAAAHFDNIPDTLFKSGKPNNHNTNKANSQRCSIIALMPDGSGRRFTTKLHTWSRKERDVFLAGKSNYVSFKAYEFDDQIPRIESASVLEQLSSVNARTKRLKSLLSAEGEYEIHVAGVARNFIGIRKRSSSGTVRLAVANEEDFVLVLGLLASRRFFDYWRTVGDGFHVTRSVIVNMPFSQTQLNWLKRKLPHVREMWKRRKKYEKKKLNGGKIIATYDFSGQLESTDDF